jgi:hypothetical protein
VYDFQHVRDKLDIVKAKESQIQGSDPSIPVTSKANSIFLKVFSAKSIQTSEDKQRLFAQAIKALDALDKEYTKALEKQNSEYYHNLGDQDNIQGLNNVPLGSSSHTGHSSCLKDLRTEIDHRQSEADIRAETLEKTSTQQSNSNDTSVEKKP